ncbi:hypothetical protein IG631_10308 [Alternaria alternata]|nr:hypothetical protein IG631_10308 [Alternaria alternata]
MSGSFHIGRGCGPEQVLQVDRRRQHRGPASACGVLGPVWPAHTASSHSGHGRWRANNRRVKLSNAGCMQERLAVQHARGSAYSPP